MEDLICPKDKARRGETDGREGEAWRLPDYPKTDMFAAQKKEEILEKVAKKWTEIK